MEYVKKFIEFLLPDPAYYAPVILLLATIVGLLISLKIKRWHPQRANQVLGIVVAGLLLTIMASNPISRWQIIVALLPAIMVAYQAFFLWLYQPKEIRIDEGAVLRKATRESLRRAQNTVDNHFSVRTLFIRYGFPAVLLGVTGILVLNVLINPDQYFSLIKAQGIVTMSDATIKRILLGIQFGSIGAYVYVLLELSRRTFRHDITGASAMWCLVTIVLGAVLAATVAVLWRMEAPQNSEWWGSGVVLFFTGFAPRRVVAAIEQAAAQLLKIGSRDGVVETRMIPLTKIRGIGPQIEERLAEEGIVDVNALAMAEPVRLVRNTAFDLKQILAWIDEAILLVTLPKSWEALEEQGITGAMDLAWYNDLVVDNEGHLIAQLPQQITELADKAKLTSPASLVSVIRRLHDDVQVQYIYALYMHFTGFSAGDSAPAIAGQPAASAQAATGTGD